MEKDNIKNFQLQLKTILFFKTKSTKKKKNSATRLIIHIYFFLC